MTDAIEEPRGGPAAADDGRNPPPTESDSPSFNPGETLETLQQRHAELSDAFLRAKADVENTRRRGEEEISKARKFAVETFAESMLPVKDSLEAAIAIPDATSEQLLEGVHATLRQLTTVLARNKVVEIAPKTGDRFDPHRHQAISVVPASGQAPGSVVAILQKGYLLADRVLRPALVTVSESG